jgi:hypothetical protein
MRQSGVKFEIAHGYQFMLLKKSIIHIRDDISGCKKNEREIQIQWGESILNRTTAANESPAGK